MGPVKLVGLDTNLFVYLYQKHPHFLDFVKPIFEKLEQNKLKAITSILTIAELLSYPLPEKEAREIENLFFTTPNLGIQDVDRYICLEAAKIRQNYKFPLPDAIQVATAKYSEADIFITNDYRLKKFKALKVVLLQELK